MIRMALAIGVLAMLAGCAQQTQPPDAPPVDCPDPLERPVDGGLGGTGKAPPQECKPEAS